MDDCLCLCHLLKAAASCCEKKLGDAVSGLKVSQCQASVLMRVQEDGTATMSSLSRTMCCHKSNITQIVDGLCEQGLLARSLSKEDRRVCYVSLTAKGKSTVKAASAAMKKTAKACVNMFSAKERTVLTKLLERYVEDMQAKD
jgi:DNA-binding MarR family transcriptional regulator